MFSPWKTDKLDTYKTTSSISNEWKYTVTLENIIEPNIKIRLNIIEFNSI